MSSVPTLALGIVLALGTGLLAGATLEIRGRAPAAVASIVLAAAAIVGPMIALSLMDALRPGWILAVQLLVALGAAALWVLTGRHPPSLRLPGLRESRLFLSRHPAVGVVLALAGCALLVQLIMVLSVAQSNWDAMAYHLSRAAYWLQNHSATHFDGGSARQLENPPNAELLTAWTMSLSGTDRFVGLVQWAALPGVAVMIFGGARLLRLSAAAAAFAAGLFVLLPQPIMQATTTQNDLIAALFITASAFFGIRGIRDRARGDLLVAGVAAGLAVGTKGTAFYAAPSILLLVGAALWVFRPPARLVAVGAAALGAGIIAFGAFNYVLNVDDTGSPFGALDQQVRREDPLKPNLIRVTWTLVDLPGTTLPWLDRLLFEAAQPLRDEVLTAGFAFSPDYNVQEDTSAFGPLGLLLLAPLIAGVLLSPRSRWGPRLVAAASLLYLLVLGTLVNWTPHNGRVMIEGVALAAPLLGLLYARPWLRTLAIVVALVGLLPALFVNQQKPIFPETNNPSIFNLDRIAQQTPIRPEVNDVIRRVNADLGPDAPLGYVGSEDSWDYPFFGEHRERRVERVLPDDYSAEAMRSKGVAGVLFANVELPAGLEATKIGSEFYLVRAEDLPVEDDSPVGQ